jgi:hypothetical protein
VLSPFYLNHRSNHNRKGYVHSIPLCVTLDSKSEGFGSRFSCFLPSSNSLSKSDAIFRGFFFKFLKGWDEKKEKRRRRIRKGGRSARVFRYRVSRQVTRLLMPNCLPPLVSLHLQWRTRSLSLFWNAIIVLIFFVLLYSRLFLMCRVPPPPPPCQFCW